MDDAGWLPFVFKLATTAAVVVVTCRVVERAGPVLGGLVATLPITIVPTFTFLAMEHDAAFIGDTALGGIRALTATTAFIVAYGLTVTRIGLAGGLAAGLAAWLATALAPRPDGIWAGAAIFAPAMVVAMALLRRVRQLRPTLRGGTSRWDVPMRAAGAMALVALALWVGRNLGAAAAGLAAMAPVVMTSLGLMLHRRLGGTGASAVLANMLPGIIGNAVAVVTLNLTAVALGAAGALSLALGICIAWNLGLLALARRGYGNS